MPRRGFVVNSFTKGDLRDLFWAQATMAAKLAERATTRMSKADFDLLEQIHARHEGAVAEHHQEAAARLGHQFHRTINLAAQAPRLALLLGSLTKQLPNRFYASIEGQLEDAVASHPIIMNALREQDADAARSLMFRHILSGAEHLIAMLETAGNLGRAPSRNLPRLRLAKCRPIDPARTARSAGGSLKIDNR